MIQILVSLDIWDKLKQFCGEKSSKIVGAWFCSGFVICFFIWTWAVCIISLFVTSTGQNNIYFYLIMKKNEAAKSLKLVSEIHLPN